MTQENINNNISWHITSINKEDRQKLHGHKSFVIWLTGLSGSGKSTLANALQQQLYQLDISVYVLDGDNLRHGINKNLSFGDLDRKENIRRTAEVSKLLVDAGIVAIAALISPFEEDRKMARSLVKSDEFVEIYVKCPIQECELRDPKGLYKKVRAGEIQQFTGIDQPYEEPKNPDLIINTEELSVQEASAKILAYIKNKNLLKNKLEE
jgi:adenylylsulfate kinase